jgi:hypothetical protein
MPKKFKAPARVETVSPRVFLFGDGTRSYFAGDPVHGSVEEARDHWGRCRREVWADAMRFSVPKGARAHDGLRNDAIEILRWSWSHSDFPLDAILNELELDRESVAMFRAENPRGAREIGDFLETFLFDLDAVEAVARRLAAGDAVDRAELWTSENYGVAA